MRKYVDISGLDRAEVLLALYENAGCPGLGGVEALGEIVLGKEAFSLADAERAMRNGERGHGVFIDYLRGRQMKLLFCDKHPNRLNIEDYQRCADRPAQEVIDALRVRAAA